MLEIWHNPRCSKSRQTLQLIEEAGVEVTVRRYLEDPPTTAELDRVLRVLEMEPADLARLGEVVARELGLRTRQLTRQDWLETLVAHPVLIERPVVIRDDGRVRLGRPPENVQDLL